MKPETSNELRGLVREVLKEAMANRGAPKQGTETVRIASDADLQAFIARLSSPGIIEAVRSGKLFFTLAQFLLRSFPFANIALNHHPV